MIDQEQVDKLLTLYQDQIQIHKAVKFINSPESGWGVYLNSQELPESLDNRHELMRIPQRATLNVSRCVELVSSLDDKLQQFFNNCVRNYIMEINQAPAETAILNLYIVLFIIVSDECELREMCEYLKILKGTEISNPWIELISEGEYSSQLWDSELLVENEMTIKQLEVVYAMIKNEYKELSITFPEFLHLQVVIRSRVLEIPQLISLDSEDFTVDTTLVPFLDFANHDNVLQNLWFDIDRDNNDVLLIYEGDLKSEEQVQIYISYSPLENLNQFVYNYGFIPLSKGKKVVDISLNREHLLKYNPKMLWFSEMYGMGLKLSFIIHYDNEWELEMLDLSSNLIFLSMSDDLKMVDGDTVQFQYKGVEEIEDPMEIVQQMDTQEIDHVSELFKTYVKENFEYKLSQYNDSGDGNTVTQQFNTVELHIIRLSLTCLRSGFTN